MRISKQIDAALGETEAFAAKIGVSLRVFVKNKKTLSLELIERSDGEKGAGALAMQHLCDLADRLRMTVKLYVFAADESLMDYYRRFGFDIDPRSDDEANMHRPPTKIA